MKILKAMLLGATALAGTSAVAADLPVRSAAPAPVYAAPMFTWTGFYVGANVGWARTNTDVRYDYPVLLGDGPGGGNAYYFPNGFKLDNDGFTAGVQIGYNWQVSQFFVWGVEADVNWLDGKNSRTHISDSYYDVVNPTAVVIPGGYYSELTASTRMNWLATARLRAGFLLTPNLLFYATGGAAVGNVRTSTSGYYDYGKGVSQAIALSPYGVSYYGSSNKTRFGWAAGLGAEWAFSPSWSMKLEWLHYDLGSTSHTVAGAYTEVTLGQPFRGKVDHTGDMIRVGLNYRFGGPAYSAPVVARY